MPLRKPKPNAQEQLTKALRALERVMTSLDARFPSVFHPYKCIWYQFLRGIAQGLGLVVAVAIVVPLLIGALQQVEWVPLFGDFVTEIVENIEKTQ